MPWHRAITQTNPAELLTAVGDGFAAIEGYLNHKARMWTAANATDPGQQAEAIQALKKAVQLEPADPYFRGKLGSSLGKAGRYMEAIAELKEAVRLKPAMPEAHFSLGLAYLGVRNRLEAAQQVKELSRLDPDLAKQLQIFLNGNR